MTDKKLEKLANLMMTEDEQDVYCTVLSRLAKKVDLKLYTRRCCDWENRRTSYDVASRILSAHIATNNIKLTQELVPKKKKK